MDGVVRHVDASQRLFEEAHTGNRVRVIEEDTRRLGTFPAKVDGDVARLLPIKGVI